MNIFENKGENKMKHDKYNVYEDGYNNGVQFAYIPTDFSKEEMRIWAMGYKNAQNKIRLTVAEIYAL
jgi:hypothetical protein